MLAYCGPNAASVSYETTEVETYAVARAIFIVNFNAECTKTCHFQLKNRKTNLDLFPGGEGAPLLTPHPLGASFLALAMIRPPVFKPWIRPCVGL